MIAEGAYYGMQTFDQALLKHYQDGNISMEEALKAATHPHDFKLLVAAEGQRSTSVEQIYSNDRFPGHRAGQDGPGRGRRTERILVVRALALPDSSLQLVKPWYHR